MHKARAIFKILSSVIIFIILFSACSSLPKIYIEQQQLTPDERVVFNQKVFDAAWIKVNKKYFDTTFNGKGWYGSLHSPIYKIAYASFFLFHDFDGNKKDQPLNTQKVVQPERDKATRVRNDKIERVICSGI